MKKEIRVYDVISWARSGGISPKKIQETLSRLALAAFTRFLDASVLENQIKNYSFIVSAGQVFLRLGKLQHHLIFPVHRRREFGHFQVLGMPIYSRPGFRRAVKNHHSFFKLLGKLSVMEPRKLSRSKMYFENSLANMLLAVLRRSPTEPERTFLRRGDGNISVLCESLCISGHLLYPFPKVRENFSLSDSLAYSNEGGNGVGLRLLAVPRPRGIFSSVKFGREDFYRNFFGGWFGELTRSLSKPAEYILIPLHPWQLENVAFIKDFIIREGGGSLLPFSIPAKSLVSIRTLHCPSLGLDVKLSLGTFITSEKRVIYQHRAQNAPIISSIISKLLQDKELGNFRIQEDVASARYLDFVKGPFATCIFRKPIIPHKRKYILPALYLFDPFAGTGNPPLYNEVIKFLSLHPHQDICDFFKEYCRIMLTGPLRMFFVYGIGLEPHLQNCLIEFQNSAPTCLIMRDVDGVNISKKRIVQFMDLGLYNFHPRTWDLMRPDHFSKDRIYHSLIFSHLETLISFFHNHFELDEMKLWIIARDIIDDLINRNLTDVPSGYLSKELRRTGGYFLGKFINIKCLLGMKLNRSENFITQRSLNPLHKSI